MTNQSLTIYHNPRCSKSRQALELLNEHEVSASVVEYLKNPLDRVTLERIAEKLAENATDLIRTQDSQFKELNIDSDALTKEKCISLLLEYPQLMQRPIIESTKQAIIARPPEKLLSMLENV